MAVSRPIKEAENASTNEKEEVDLSRNPDVKKMPRREIDGLKDLCALNDRP